MNKILVVAKKEMKELINNKRTFITGVFFALWFSVFTSLAIKGVDSPAAFLNNLVFYLALTIGVFIAYIFSGQVFLREKREKIIETLLCTPLSLRSIWLGKVMGVTLPAHLVSILTVALVIAISNALSPSLLFPSAAVLFHLLVVVPAFIAFAAGLMGFCQFLLGMRENQIIGLLVFCDIIRRPLPHQQHNEGGFYCIMVGGWSVASHCSAFTGTHNILDQISE